MQGIGRYCGEKGGTLCPKGNISLVEQQTLQGEKDTQQFRL